jgi:hypothetical protein
MNRNRINQYKLRDRIGAIDGPEGGEGTTPTREVNASSNIRDLERTGSDCAATGTCPWSSDTQSTNTKNVGAINSGANTTSPSDARNGPVTGTTDTQSGGGLQTIIEALQKLLPMLEQFIKMLSGKGGGTNQNGASAGVQNGGGAAGGGQCGGAGGSSGASGGGADGTSGAGRNVVSSGGTEGGVSGPQPAGVNEYKARTRDELKSLPSIVNEESLNMKFSNKQELIDYIGKVEKEYGLPKNWLVAQFHKETSLLEPSQSLDAMQYFKGDTDRGGNYSGGIGQISRAFLDNGEWSNDGPAAAGQTVSSKDYDNSLAVQVRTAALMMNVNATLFPGASGGPPLRAAASKYVGHNQDTYWNNIIETMQRLNSQSK